MTFKIGDFVEHPSGIGKIIGFNGGLIEVNLFARRIRDSKKFPRIVKLHPDLLEMI